MTVFNVRYTVEDTATEEFPEQLECDKKCQTHDDEGLIFQENANDERGIDEVVEKIDQGFAVAVKRIVEQNMRCNYEDYECMVE